MSVVLEPIVDALHGEAPVINRGWRLQALSRKAFAPHSYFESDGRKVGVSEPPIDGVLVDLRAIASRLERVAQAGKPGGAYRAVELVRESLPSVADAARYFERLDRSTADASRMRREGDPFERARAQTTLDDAAERSTSDAHRRDTAIAALDRIVALGLFLVTDANAGCVRRMRAVLDEMAAVGAGVGWSPAATLDDSFARVRSHVPCASLPGEQDAERCYLTPVERASLQQRLSAGMLQLGLLVELECERLSADIGAAIDRDQRLGEFIATEIADGVVKVLTGDVGASVADLPVGRSTEAVARAARATAAAKSVAAEARKFGLEFARSSAWSSVKEVNKFLPAADEADPRYRTVKFIEGLSASYHVAARSLSARAEQLDDHDLDLLVHNVENTTVGEIGRRVDDAIRLHREQVEPLGSSSVDLGYPSPRKTVTVAAWLTQGERKRLAMVRHESDLVPEMLRQGRARVAAVKELGRALGGPEVFDGYRRQQDEAWIATPDEEIEFVRWIEPALGGGSIDLAPVAAEGAIELPIERVRGVPLADTMQIGGPGAQ